MLEVGKIVSLSNDKNYVVINIMELHNIKYVFLISDSKPLEVVIGVEKEKNGETVLEEIKDNDELDYILSKFTLLKQNDDEFDD